MEYIGLQIKDGTSLRVDQIFQPYEKGKCQIHPKPETDSKKRNIDEKQTYARRSHP